MQIAVVLTLLALAIAGLGMHFGSRTRRPRLFKWGSIIASAGLMLLWLLPWWAISQQAGIWSMPLMIAALVIAVAVLGGGLSAMARAATGQVDTEVDKIVQDLSYLNDLP